MRMVLAFCLACAAVALAQPAPAVLGEASARIVVAAGGRPNCGIVVTEPADSWLMRSAADAIRSTVHRWSGADMPVEPARRLSDRPPEGPLIVVATLEALQRDLGRLATAVPLAAQTAFLDEQGFVCAGQRIGDVPCVLVVGRTPRGVYNGAIWLRDFCIDGSREKLEVLCPPVVRTPRLSGRAAYTLTIWGHEAEYTVADWETIFDSFARDGFDRVYFWVSGHFPSKRFPSAYKCRDDKWDTTEKSRIASIEDLRRIVRAAHDRGLAIYAGGALGAWCCTYALTDLAAGTMKTPQEKPYPPPSSLCPSHPASRQALVDYCQEVFDALPEADGLFIESADEWGGCYCPACSREVDDQGSVQFGQSQLTLVQEIMLAVWRDHPHARLCYTIGYDEHRSDPAYYELIRRMSDARFEWMEARDNWVFPVVSGQSLPACAFSRQVMRWQQYYARPLDQLVADAARVSQSGMFGLITAFEPGFSSGSFHTQIPHPTSAMPYVLTGFLWREATWSPGLSADAMRDRVQRRFFGREASTVLAQDLWDLRELIREAAGSNRLKPAPQAKLAAIEQHVREARSQASPKTAETLDLMAEAIGGVRSHATAAGKDKRD